MVKLTKFLDILSLKCPLYRKMIINIKRQIFQTDFLKIVCFELDAWFYQIRAVVSSHE